jgi:hypothetical protein
VNFLSCGTTTSALLRHRLVTFSYLPWNVTPNSAPIFIEPCLSLEANSYADGQISQLVRAVRLYCIPGAGPYSSPDLFGPHIFSPFMFIEEPL